MTVVYPLGKGSRWQDNELRYSLRSVEMYLQGFTNVVVVGEKPEWIQNVLHIPHAAARSYVFKESNIYEKIMLACDHRDVSSDFIFFNDDHFLLKPSATATFPYYHKGSLESAIENRPKQSLGDEVDVYGRSLKKTLEVLQALKLTTTNFDCHAPIVYNKELFKAALSPLNWEQHYGYVIKSLYSNLCHIKGTYLRDCKINSPIKMDVIDQMLFGRPFFSCGDKGLQGDLKKYLDRTFPTKSKFEK